MKNKGFTLVELLAVIILISVIAIITIPRIDDSLKQSKENVVKNSALSYKKAVEQYVYQQNMNKNNITLNGKYGVANGNLENYEIELTGKKPSSGYLTYENNELKRGCLYINNYAITFVNGDITNIEKEQCTSYISSSELPHIVTTGDGLYESTTEPGRYIYRGETPNNYIYINEGTIESPNNVLYRIISFEPDGTIKVVRNQSIGNIAWDPTNARPTATHSYCTNSSSYGCNVWGNTANTYLGNNTFDDNNSNFYYQYFKTPITSAIEQVNEGGTVSKDAYLNTYLNPTSTSQTNKWDKALIVDKYLIEHSFDVGGVYYNASYESSKGIEKEKQEEKSLTWNGKIGLMSITEFVEASTNTECTLWNNYYGNPTYYYKDEGASSATHHAPENNNYPCKKYNWTITGANQWSISSYSGNKYGTWILYGSGSFSNDYTNYNRGVRPTFYLKPTTKLSGTGTNSDPYKIVQ